MSASRDGLAARRQQLVLRSSQVRSQLVVQSAALSPVLAWGDRARAVFHWVRAHPEAVLTFGVVVVVARPRGAFRWGMRLWSAVRLVRRIRGRLSAWESGRARPGGG